MAKITVLMPTYNSEKFISEAVDSILNQSFENFELFIIDDGSTDNTCQIIKGFTDKRIRYLKRDHKGLASTLNYGIQNSDTDLIARMDADDLSDPRRLHYQFEFLDKNPDYDIVGTNIYVINSSNKILYSIEYPEDDSQIKENLLIHSVIAHSAVLMKHDLFDKVGYYDTKNDTIEDYDLWLRSIKAAKFYNIQKYLHFYRKHYNSLTGTWNSFLSERRKAYFIMQKFLSSNNIQEIVTDKDKSILNTRFLVRYSPYFEVKKILNNQYLSFYQKIYYLFLSVIPFNLKCFYFFFNPKLRIKFLFNNLVKSHFNL